MPLILLLLILFSMVSDIHKQYFMKDRKLPKSRRKKILPSNRRIVFYFADSVSNRSLNLYRSSSKLAILLAHDYPVETQYLD